MNYHLPAVLPDSRAMKGTVWALGIPITHEDIWEVLLLGFFSAQDANGSGMNGPCKYLAQQWHISAEFDS